MMAVTDTDKLQLLYEGGAEEVERGRGARLRGMPMLGHTIQVMRQ